MKLILQLITLVTLQVSICLSKVQFVSQMYRHGARTAGFFLPYQEKQTPGMLTGVGMRQQYQLGQIMRKKYIKEEQLLDETFNFDQFHIFVTDDVDRLFQSASSNLLGFYPMGTGLDIFPNVEDQYLVPPDVNAKYYDIGEEAVPFKFQPPPIHASTVESDELMYPHCKNKYLKLAEWVAKPKQLLTVNKYIKQSKPTTESLTEVFGTNINVVEIFPLYDSITADLYQNRYIPEGFTPELYYNMTQLSAELTYFLSGDKEQNHISTSNYLRQVLQNWDDNINQKFDLKWDMVSGHDSNLWSFLPALNITSSKCVSEEFETGSTDALNCQSYPIFASCLLIELNQDDDSGDYFVRINYNGEYQNLCEKEETTCDYDEFVQRILNQTFDQDEIDEKCGNAVDEDYIVSQISQSFLNRIKKLSEEKEGKMDHVEFMKIALDEISQLEINQEQEQSVEQIDSLKFLGQIMDAPRNLQEQEGIQQEQKANSDEEFENQVVYGLFGLIFVTFLNLIRKQFA